MGITPSSENSAPRYQQRRTVACNVRIEMLEGRSLASSLWASPSAGVHRLAQSRTSDVRVVHGLVEASKANAETTKLLQNGSFESIGVKLHSKAATIAAGSDALHGWQIVSGDIDVQAYWQTVSGKLSLDLNGTAPGTITQSFATVVGKSYQLSFFYANNPDSRGLTANTNVTVAGQTTAITHLGSTATAMNYAHFSSTFVATATSTSLTFASTTSGAYGIVLDAVSVKASA